MSSLLSGCWIRIENSVLLIGKDATADHVRITGPAMPTDHQPDAFAVCILPHDPAHDKVFRARGSSCCVCSRWRNIADVG
jgi:hypothetical protein